MIWALHGAFGDAADWQPLATALGGGAIRPHPIGEAAPSPGAGPLVAVDVWAEEHALTFPEWAEGFAREVGRADPAPVLLGYSMGARLGLHALIRAPDLWRGAVLVAPHPGLPDPEERAARRAHDDEWLERFDRLEWSAFWRAWSDQPVLRAGGGRPAPAERDAKRRGLGAWSLAEQEDLRPRLPEIRCPVLWVTGQRDEKYASIAADVVPSLPRAIHLVIRDAGHRVPWDAPGAFATVVDAFARGLEGSGGA